MYSINFLKRKEDASTVNQKVLGHFWVVSAPVVGYGGFRCLPRYLSVTQRLANAGVLL